MNKSTKLIVDGVNFILSKRGDIKLEELIDVIRTVGLVYDKRGAELYGSSEIEYMNEDGTIYQKPKEFARFLLSLKDKNINSVIEIGTHKGGTFAIMCAYLKSINDKFYQGVTIDKKNKFIAQEELSRIMPIKLLVSDSSIVEFSGFDLAFIDGDHSYEGVKRDFLRFGKQSKFCALHDVADKDQPGVVKLWQEIYHNKEMFLEPPFNTMGIGLVKNSIIKLL